MSNLNDIFFTPAANQELTYDQVLEDVQRYFAENHASTIAEAGEGNAERATSLLKELMEHYIVKRKYALDGLSTKELCSKLYEDMAGYSLVIESYELLLQTLFNPLAAFILFIIFELKSGRPVACNHTRKTVHMVLLSHHTPLHIILAIDEINQP